MLAALIRLLSIQGCTYYIYIKLLNLECSKTMKKLPVIVVITILAYYLGILIKMFIIPIMILITSLYLILSSKNIIKVNITASIISYGVGFFIYTIANFVSSIIRIVFSNMPFELFSIIILLIQTILVVLLFKIKRLKNGMPFLKNIIGTDSGVIISIFLLIGIVILFCNDYNYIYAAPFFAVLLLGSLIYIWWRKRLTNLYISNKKESELNELKKQLVEKEQRILYLEQQNSELSKIIHRDNKLIPALVYAVKSQLDEINITNDLATIKIKGQELLAHLEKISLDRFTIIKNYQFLNKDIPKTKVSSIDALLSYMLNKASSAGVIFDVNVMGSIIYMVESIINDKDLSVLLAELIDNALIAVKKCENKRVYVTLGIVDKAYVVYVLDSGEPFAPEVLNNIGKKQITTHQKEGGSGIGLMTIYEVVNKYRASLDIIALPSDSIYTKRIAISF